MEGFREVKLLPKHKKLISNIVVSKNEKHVIISSSEGDAHLYKISELFKNEKINYKKIDSTSRFNDVIAFSPDNEKIAIAKRYGDIKLFNLKGELIGVCKGHKTGNGGNTAIDELIWAHDSNKFLSLGRQDRKTIIWKLSSLRRTFYSNKDFVYGRNFAVNNDKNLFAFIKRGQQGKYISISDLSGREIDSLPFFNNASVHNANKLNVFVCIVDSTIKLWDKKFYTLKKDIDSDDFNRRYNSYPSKLPPLFSVDDKILRVILNSAKDTLSFDVLNRNQLKLSNKKKKELRYIKTSKASNWDVDWERKEFQQGYFELVDKVRGDKKVILEGQNKNVIISSREDENGLISTYGYDGIEIFNIDIKSVIKNLKLLDLD